MAKQSPKQQKIVGRVMHEWKHGQLKTRGGRKVKNPKQAVAIGLSEAGASNRQSPKKNARNLARTERRKRQGQTGRQRSEGGRGGRSAASSTKSALYAQAKRRNIAGRSRMSKSQLARALGK